MRNISAVLALVITHFLVIINGQLYTKEDHVRIFDDKSFDVTFRRTPVDNWLIQFYSSMCGHCINFAPKFKEFLKEAQFWKEMKVGVIDCSVYMTICNEHSVEYFPFFKLFLNHSSAESSPKGMDVTLDKSSVQTVFKSVISLMKKYIDPPVLVEAKSVIRDTAYILVEGGDRVNLERTMLLFSCHLIHPLYYRYKDRQTNYVVTVKDGSYQLSYKFENINALFKWIGQYFHIGTTSPTKRIGEDDIAMSNTKMVVYNQDIYSSIIYSFNYEIFHEDLIEVGNVVIMKNFVEKLYQYSRISDQLTEAFKKLVQLLEKRIEAMKSSSKVFMKWKEMIRQSKLPDMKPTWIGCNGSLSYFRRFPCGFWTLFHTLTVNHLHLQSTKNDDSRDLIKSIRTYIIAFFKCVECSQNFKKETSDFETFVTNSSQAVLYLWKIHNSVNKRLSKQPSEDPKFPKVAFPPLSMCPSCRLRTDVLWPEYDQWNIPNVLRFLDSYYSARVKFTPPEHFEF